MATYASASTPVLEGKRVYVYDGSEGKNENQNFDIINHGSGVSGSWNENSDIKSHGSGASGSW